MKMDSSLINRILAVITSIICVLLLEKYHVNGGWAFWVGVLWVIGMSFLFELIRGIVGE
jgi:hypothetical protein